MKTACPPPPVAASNIAFVHLAIYDVVESIDRRSEAFYTRAGDSLSAGKDGHDVAVGAPAAGKIPAISNARDQTPILDGRLYEKDA